MNHTVEILGFAREAAWLPWAVQYFFLIGISTAAFFLSLPGVVWRLPAWQGISRHALLAALVCGLTAPVALLADLHQPGRFLNFYLHPNLGSWMAWGAFFIPLYLIGLVLYAWLCLQPQFAAMADRRDRLSVFYRILAYGGHHNSRAIRAAAAVGGIGAVLILLYTNMEVMVVQARPMWHTPILPLLFLVTALSGGLGMIALFEAFSRRRSAAFLLKCWLERCQWASLGLLSAWLILAVSGISTSAADTLAAMRGSSGWLMTGAWLWGSIGLTLWLARSSRESLVFPALFALHGTWLVRWIVFIGAQNQPKMGTSTHIYSLSLTPDSVLGMVGMAGICLTVYIVLTSIIPWDDRLEA